MWAVEANLLGLVALILGDARVRHIYTLLVLPLALPRPVMVLISQDIPPPVAICFPAAIPVSASHARTTQQCRHQDRVHVKMCCTVSDCKLSIVALAQGM